MKQSGVSIIIAESSKDVNPGIYEVQECKKPIFSKISNEIFMTPL